MDAQLQDPPSTPVPSIADLTGGDSSVLADLVKAKKAQVAEDTSIIGAADKRMNEDQARVDKAFKAEGFDAAEQLKPWDADKEHKKYETDPIQGFGSIGGLFAVIASAFTKTPMDNAINGMAGAINSIKEGKEEDYQRAYKSWQDNTKLALDRFKTQHEMYQDALGLMDHDATAAQVKLRNAAVRFGDQQTLMLAEHGMVKELFELQEARARSASQLQALSEQTTEQTLRNRAFQAGAEALPKTGNPAVDAAHKLALYNRVYGLSKETPQQELMGQYFLDHPDATADEAAEFADKHGIIRQYGTVGSPKTPSENQLVAQEVSRRANQYVEQEGMEPAAAFDRAMKEVKAAEAKPGGATDKEEIKEKKASDIVDGIASGKQSPATTGLYGLAPEVRAEAAKRGLDLEAMQLEELAAKKQIQSLNGPPMVRFIGLAQSVDNTIDEARRLSKEMDNLGIPSLNKLKLEALVNVEGNSERGQLATKYLTTINTLKEEFANLANGGYAPTEATWKLADQQINANYGVKQLDAALSEAQRLIRYRLNAIPGLKALGPGATNSYLPGKTGDTSVSIPDAAARELKEGVVTTFKNGQKWTLRNGQPEQIQ